MSGLRLVDLTQTPESLGASTLLADLGAEVILVEFGEQGHRARQVGPLKGSTSLLWKATARNKTVVRAPADRAAATRLILELCDGADAVIIDQELLDLAMVSIEDLAARRADLIVVAHTLYGLDGPRAGMPGNGRGAEAFGGQVFASGEPEREPLHSGLPLGSGTAAMFAALGVMAAVIERDMAVSPLGQVVDVAAYETVLRVMDFLPIFYQQTGFENRRSGGGSSYQVPVATWATADGKWASFTGNTNDIVHRLYRAMGRPELVDDERYATNEARVANRGIVEATLSAWAASVTLEQLQAACDAHDVPIAAVFSMADIFADAHYAARGTIVAVSDHELGEARVPRAMPRFSRSTPEVRHLGHEVAGDDVAWTGEWGRDAVRPPLRAPEQAASSRPGPLRGLRVLDIGQILAGPYACTLLADLGADVVKVEKRKGGDDFRRQAPLKDGISLWWKASARNKRSIALDLKAPEDRDVFFALVAEADLVVANFVPGALERLGLSYEELRELNPSIVLLTVSGYGQDGPLRDRRAFGRNAEGFGGLSHVTGYEDGPPLPTGYPVADAMSATLGALGALCALYERARTDVGVGQHIDVALYETIIRLGELNVLMYDQLGVVAGRPPAASTAGETLCVARSVDGVWFSAANWDLGPLAPDTPELGDRLGELERHIRALPADVLRANPLQLGRYVVTPVNGIADLATDPHVAARRFLATLDDPELHEVRLVGIVPRFSRTPGVVASASPVLDADRDAVLADWLGRGGATVGAAPGATSEGSGPR